MTTVHVSDFEHLDSRIAVPRYDRENVSVGIVHFGVGGFHRAHQAVVIDDLLAAGETSWGICGVGLLPGDARMRDALRAQDGAYTLLTRAPDGRREARVIGSIIDYVFAPDEPDRVMATLIAPTTRIVSLTITEGGYLRDHATDEFDPHASAVLSDASHPHSPTGVFGYIVEALRLRRSAGIPPFTVMSCDNVKANGRIAREATVGYARMLSGELADWIDENVRFPSSMVDRITPVTTPEVGEMLRDEYGVDDAWPVASEDFFQWVLEDDFGDGRPRFEDAAVQVVADVVPYELMKLRLLNASHQVLAYLGSVAGYRLVDEAVTDPDLAHVLRRFWKDEAIPTLPAIPGIDYSTYTETLLQRYANPHVRDTLERLATDASNRIPVFVLPIVADCLATGRASTVGALTVAAWEKYVLGVDDHGGELVQHDERSEELVSRAGRTGQQGFLEDVAVFGDLGARHAFVTEFERCRGALAAHPVPEAIRVILNGDR